MAAYDQGDIDFREPTPVPMKVFFWKIYFTLVDLNDGIDWENDKAGFLLKNFPDNPRFLYFGSFSSDTDKVIEDFTRPEKYREMGVNPFTEKIVVIRAELNYIRLC